MKPHPLHTRQGRQAAQQRSQTAFAIQVHPVIGRILGHYDQLLHAPGHEPSGLFEHLLLGHRHVRPPDKRNGAVGTAPVTPLRDLQVGVMRRRGQHPFRGGSTPLAAGQRSHHGGEIACTEIVVHFGDLAPQLLGIPFAQATDHEEAVDRPLLLGLHETEDGIDRLLFRVAYEAACIDHHRPRIRPVGVEHHLVSRRSQLRHEVLGIHHVLGTTERNDIDLFRSVFFHLFRFLPEAAPEAAPRFPIDTHAMEHSSRRSLPRTCATPRTGRPRTPSGRRFSTDRFPRRCRCSAPVSGTGR